MYVLAIISSLCFGTAPLCYRQVVPTIFPTQLTCAEVMHELRLTIRKLPWSYHCVPFQAAIPFVPYENDPRQR